jgi:hypothetical protein
MKNILKNNGLMHLCAFLVMIFVGNVFSMVIRPKDRERAKVAAQKMMTQIKEQQQQIKLQQEREKQYQSDKYFVFEKDTSKGILVDQNFLDNNSEMVKNMIQDVGSKPKEIVLPFPIEIIKIAFTSSNPRRLTLNQLVDVFNCFDYLLMNNNSDLINEIVARINYIGYQIMDEKNIPDYTVFGKIQDPSVVKIILDKVFSIQNKFYNDFVRFYKSWYGYGLYGEGTAQIEVQSQFGRMTSISAMLDKIEKFFSSIAEARAEVRYFS